METLINEVSEQNCGRWISMQINVRSPGLHQERIDVWNIENVKNSEP